MTQQATSSGIVASARGFAAMDPNRQRELARKGGRAAHQKGSAHRFTAVEAQAAGRKGGQSVGRDRQHMAMIGKKGGKISGAMRQKTAPIVNGEAVDATPSR